MKKLIFFTMLTFLGNIVNAQWTTQFSGTSTFLTSVFFPSPDTGYITKENGGLLKTVNGGNNWSVVSPIGTAGNIYFTSNDTGYSIYANKILKTINGATSWTIKNTTATIYFRSIFFADNNTGYVLGTDSSASTGYIYKTTNAGENWFLQSTISLDMVMSIPYIFFTDINNGYLVNYSSNIYKTTDGGLNWSTQIIDSTGYTAIYSIHFPSFNIGYAVGMSYSTGIAICKTTDAGLTWTSQYTDETNPLYSVYFTNNNIGYAVGGNGINSGTVIKTIDGGNIWSLATVQSQTFNSVCFPNNNTGYAVGTNGTIIKYFDNSSNIGNENQLPLNNSSFIYPNPTTGKLNITISKSQINDINNDINIYNSLGENIYSFRTFKTNFEINLSSQPKGIYFVKFNDGNKIYSEKVLIK